MEVFWCRYGTIENRKHTNQYIPLGENRNQMHICDAPHMQAPRRSVFYQLKVWRNSAVAFRDCATSVQQTLTLTRCDPRTDFDIALTLSNTTTIHVILNPSALLRPGAVKNLLVNGCETLRCAQGDTRSEFQRGALESLVVVLKKQTEKVMVML